MRARPTMLLMPVLLLSLVATALADPTLVSVPVAVPVDAPVDPAIRVAILVVGVLAAILGPLAVVVGRWAAKRLAAATGLDLTKDIEAAARAAVGLAEQMAERKLKESTVKMPGGEKMTIAASFFLKIAEEKGWSQWVKDRASDYIESHLGQLEPTVDLAQPDLGASLR